MVDVFVSRVGITVGVEVLIVQLHWLGDHV